MNVVPEKNKSNLHSNDTRYSNTPFIQISHKDKTVFYEELKKGKYFIFLL